MQIKLLLSTVATGFAATAVIIAVVGLVHELLTGGSEPQLFVHNLEGWVMGAGYHAALIVLVAAGVQYLARKQ